MKRALGFTLPPAIEVDADWLRPHRKGNDMTPFEFEQRGATVDYNDPYVPVIKETREHPQYAGRKSVDITDDYDCILVATHHDEYKDFDFSEFKAPLVDTRNCVARRPERYYRA